MNGMEKRTTGGTMQADRMNRVVTLEHLALVEKQVEIGDTLLAETRARIQDRLDSGLDVSEAEATLALLEQTQALRVADRDRLLGELKGLH
jgi:Fe-S cluster assembly ATPase SufC